jgi:chromosomal replication initiator protein
VFTRDASGLAKTTDAGGVRPAPATRSDAAGSIDGAWQALREQLRAEFGARTFESWFRQVELAKLDEGTAHLALPTHFMADWIRNHFLERLRNLCCQHLPGVRDVALVVIPRAVGSRPSQAPAAVLVADAALAQDQDRPLGSPLRKDWTFERFVVDVSNQVAVSAMQAVSRGGDTGFNPLFVHGGVGLGKTHLMHAAAQAFLVNQPRARVAYMTAERFMLELIGAIRRKDTVGFKQHLRSLDLLMIDDVQFLAGKASTQEEVFLTISALTETGRQLILAADRSPAELADVQDRIKSRLSGGMVVDIQPMTTGLRRRVLESKLADFADVHIPEDVRSLLCERVSSSGRELEGAVLRLAGHARLIGRPVTLDFARLVLQDLLRLADRRVSIDQIQRKVADYYQVRLSDLLSARRTRDVTLPRQIAMYLAKRLTTRSLPEIGRRFGGRDHTTVIHAVRKIKKLRETTAEIDADLMALTRQLEA